MILLLGREAKLARAGSSGPGEGPAMIPILGRGNRSVIQVKHLRGGVGEPARLEFRLHGWGEEVPLATVGAREVGLPQTYDELLSHPGAPNADRGFHRLLKYLMFA